MRVEGGTTDYPPSDSGERAPDAMEALQPPSEDAIASTPIASIEEKSPNEKKSKKKASRNARPPTRVVLVHCDIIKDDFGMSILASCADERSSVVIGSISAMSMSVYALCKFRASLYQPESVLPPPDFPHTQRFPLVALSNLLLSFKQAHE